ncbi:MAG: 5-formyltetrahydrofolate cyclo-ligase [Candidatus Omnitrophota bacterium]
MCKSDIRKRILKKLKEQKEEVRQEKSRKIKKQLFLQPQFLQSDTVMFYISKDDEVDTAAMIRDALKMGKKVVVPVTMVKRKRIIPSQLKGDKTELGKGPYGIYQPKRPFIRKVLLQDIDLAVIPGVAFDKKGNRLGRGGGYFDRFLTKLKKKKIPVFGLAFKFQILKKLPVLPHDIPVTHLFAA